MKQRQIFLAAALAGTLWAAGLAYAQAAPEAGTAVHLTVTAEPKHGNDVPVIQKNEVMVYEGKDRDQVVDWIPAQGDHSAQEVFILLDDSSSTDLGSQLDDIRKFIDGLPPATLVGVAYMRNGTAQIAQNPSSDHAAAAKALRLPQGIAGANASPYFSLSDLAKRWPESNARHSVLMVSDGIDRYYGTGDLQDPYVDAAVDDCVRKDIVVSAIYEPGAGHFGHSYWQELLGPALPGPSRGSNWRRGLLHWNDRGSGGVCALSAGSEPALATSVPALVYSESREEIGMAQREA